MGVVSNRHAGKSALCVVESRLVHRDSSFKAAPFEDSRDVSAAVEYTTEDAKEARLSETLVTLGPSGNESNTVEETAGDTRDYHHALFDGDLRAGYKSEEKSPHGHKIYTVTNEDRPTMVVTAILGEKGELGHSFGSAE